jgi:ATP/maltotriose-dependent transcriptional regulator MalT
VARWHGWALDPEVVGALLTPGGAADPLAELSERERQVLALVAEGHSNAATGAKLFMAERTVEKHMRSIFQKLRIIDTGDNHRRVLAVLAYIAR